MNKYDDNYKEIDLADFLAEFFSKIWIIALCTIVIGMAGISYAVYKGINVEPTKITEEELNSAKSNLTITEANTVERVYAQYVSYKQYKETLQDYFAGFLFSDDDITNYVQKITLYSLSSNVYGSDSIITNLALTPESYEKAKAVIPEEETVSNIYSRMWISSSASDNVLLLNDDDGIVMPDTYVIRSYVIAKSYDQCDQLQEIVDDAIQACMETVKKLDPNATLVIVGDNYSNNLIQWTIDRQNDTINKLNSAENTIKNLENNQVKNLSNSQKAYYDLLVAKDAEQSIVLKGPSKAKFLVFGAAIGFAISCVFYALKYLLDGTIKTKDTINLVYGIQVLNTVAVKGSKIPFFSRVIKALRGIDNTAIEDRISLLSSEIGVLMRKNHSHSLYIIETSKTTEESQIIDALKNAILLENSDYDIMSGAPISDAKALKEIATSDCVIIMTDLRKTKKSIANYYCDLFERYGSNVLGSVVITRP